MVFIKGVYETAVCFLVRYIGTVKYTFEPLLLQSKFSSILKVKNFDRGTRSFSFQLVNTLKAMVEKRTLITAQAKNNKLFVWRWRLTHMFCCESFVKWLWF